MIECCQYDCLQRAAGGIFSFEDKIFCLALFVAMKPELMAACNRCLNVPAMLLLPVVVLEYFDRLFHKKRNFETLIFYKLRVASR